MKKKHVRKSRRRYSKRRQRRTRTRFSRKKTRRRVRRKSRRTTKKSKKKSPRAGSSPLNEKVESVRSKPNDSEDDNKLRSGPADGQRVYLTHPVILVSIDYLSSMTGGRMAFTIKKQRDFYLYSEEKKLLLQSLNDDLTGVTNNIVSIESPIINKMDDKDGIFQIYPGLGPKSNKDVLVIKVKNEAELKQGQFSEFKFPTKENEPEFFLK